MHHLYVSHYDLILTGHFFLLWLTLWLIHVIREKIKQETIIHIVARGFEWLVIIFFKIFR